MDGSIATNIQTETFNLLLQHLKKESWKITAEYGGFDKSIDFDFYELQKGDTAISLAWSNWFEGEVKASNLVLAELEKDLGIKFQFDEAEHLNQNVFKKYSGLIKIYGNLTMPMTTTKKLKIWTIISHALIVVGAGHGIIFFFKLRFLHFLISQKIISPFHLKSSIIISQLLD